MTLFITNNKYTVGSDTTKYTYILYTTMGNTTLEYYQFNPINGLFLVSNNFNANVFTSTPINRNVVLILKDNLSNVSYTSTFVKI